jgi:hypothetical protein
MNVATVAADYYLERWASLRDQALQLAEEAKQAPGPLTKRKLRNQAALCDQYAVICHHASWRELHPDPPDG